MWRQISNKHFCRIGYYASVLSSKTILITFCSRWLHSNDLYTSACLKFVCVLDTIFVFIGTFFKSIINCFIHLYLLLILSSTHLSIRSSLMLTQNTTHDLMKYSMWHYIVLPIQLLINTYLSYNKLDFLNT